MPISTAIVLAAGRGTRLGTLTRRQPKALAKVDGVPVISRLCSQLVAAGIKEIVIVVGHLGHQIMRALGPSHQGCPIRYIGSDDFARTNNITSLALASAYRRPVVICDCDIVLETLPPAWLDRAGCDILVPVRDLADGETGCVLVDEGGDHWSIRVNRNPEPEDASVKKSLSLYFIFDAALTSAIYDGCIAAIHDNDLDLYYEDIIARVAGSHVIATIDMDAAGYQSFEIDTPLDLKRAGDALRLLNGQSGMQATPGEDR